MNLKGPEVTLQSLPPLEALTDTLLRMNQSFQVWAVKVIQFALLLDVLNSLLFSEQVKEYPL